MNRVRYSLAFIQAKYDSGEDRSLLENLIRAWRGIQKLFPGDLNSFYVIGGYHGEPFRDESAVKTNPNYWGGYCNHANVLFPVWHRAYVLQLEDALRSIPGCENVTMPFWDECAEISAGGTSPIPSILTSPTFALDGEDDNPLYSYKLQVGLDDPYEDNEYTKGKGYETVRYPLSGLVGTPSDQAATTAHNSNYTDPAANAKTLSTNVMNWLDGQLVILPDGQGTPVANDSPSVYKKYQACLDAPTYTLFSNTTSEGAYNQNNPDNQVYALEDPHNSIHLSVGGFYQSGKDGFNADAILDANGDMGENETAGFDPIFFFHHCFIDYTFWCWQKKNKMTAAGSITIDAADPGAISTGLPYQKNGSTLDMSSELYPFVNTTKDDKSIFTPADVVDIEKQLGYTYGPGSLDQFVTTKPVFGGPESPAIVHKKLVHGINRTAISGSFVVRTFAKGPAGVKFELGRDAILSRRNTANCANCQNHPETSVVVPVDEKLHKILKGDGTDEDVKYWAELHDRKGVIGSTLTGKGHAVKLTHL